MSTEYCDFTFFEVNFWKNEFPANTSIKKWKNRYILIAPERPWALWCYVLNGSFAVLHTRVWRKRTFVNVEKPKTPLNLSFSLNLSPKMSQKRQNQTFPSRRVANWKIAICKKAFPANTSIKKWENRSILIAPERPRAIWCYVLNENLSIFATRVNGILRFSKFLLLNGSQWSTREPVDLRPGCFRLTTGAPLESWNRLFDHLKNPLAKRY